MQTSGEMRRENAKLVSVVIASEGRANAMPDDRLRDAIDPLLRMDCFASLAMTAETGRPE